MRTYTVEQCLRDNDLDRFMQEASEALDAARTSGQGVEQAEQEYHRVVSGVYDEVTGRGRFEG